MEAASVWQDTSNTGGQKKSCQANLSSGRIFTSCSHLACCLWLPSSSQPFSTLSHFWWLNPAEAIWLFPCTSNPLSAPPGANATVCHQLPERVWHGWPRERLCQRQYDVRMCGHPQARESRCLCRALQVAAAKSAMLTICT